jgi:pimeloyl-ACP methyl ester carboxylesterase
MTGDGDRPRGRGSGRRAALTGLAALICAVLTVAVAPVARAAAAGSTAMAGPAVPRLHWTDCGDGLQCTTALVPLDYDHAQGTHISLALIRLPASDPGRRIGSVFLNPGGPGNSGVAMVRQAGTRLFTDEVRARFDLVGFDPRGIGGSTPLRCFDTADQANAANPPFMFPVTPADEQTWVRANQTLAQACADHGGPILAHMSTANVARDLDLLRQAVGDRQLTYYGVSYGSYLGTTYANLFPNKVRAIGVDGIVDPIAWATGRGEQARTQPLWNREHSAEGADATLAEFFRLCQQGGPTCAFSAGDAASRYATLADRLRDHPVQLPDGTAFGYADLVATTLGYLYNPRGWPGLATTLQALDTLTGPAPSALRTAAARRVAAAQEDYFNEVEGQPGVMCPDTDNPSDITAWSRAAATTDRRYPYFGRMLTWLSSICQPWPGHDADRYTGPFTARTGNPVLIVGGRYDPATRYRNAITLAHLLPDSRLLSYAGWGHISLGKSACVTGYASQYLLTVQLPPPGTVCPPDVVPFAQPTAATGGRPTREV